LTAKVILQGQHAVQCNVPTAGLSLRLGSSHVRHVAPERNVETLCLGNQTHHGTTGSPPMSRFAHFSKN